MKSESPICVTRPKRFGKTVMASVIALFLERGGQQENFPEAFHKRP
ncbi:MAG: hypothetical protein HFG77_06100 [Hungatella sp.]|nr:hypothetical protein [Hungatella sp.]